MKRISAIQSRLSHCETELGSLPPGAKEAVNLREEIKVLKESLKQLEKERQTDIVNVYRQDRGPTKMSS